ncbi:hypothetical protein IPU70_10270 [Achromobacter sp. SD115]|uniref:restriction endonuclease subunit S n=1 Tax=Achromobacter sp. SD115 TaxID=2782011 RepID=UPI001A974518|nr:hypothetical protein [Achromobacter sp. SD115]MBO1013932.1 hypothetical protein [Achromobacter sp. SD115]
MMKDSEREGSATRLGDVVTQVLSRTSPAALPQDEHFVGLEDIAQHGGPIMGSSRVSDVKSTVHRFHVDDVLYGRLRPYLRKVAVADFDGHASGEIIVLRCSEAILPRYLRMVLLSDGFSSFINASVKGDRPRTSFSALADFVVTLPTVEAQAELVRREEQLTQAIVQIDEAVKTHTSASACLLTAVRNRVVWQWNEDSDKVPLSTLLQSIQYGTTEKSVQNPGGVPVLRIPNISSSGAIDGTHLKYATQSTIDEKFQVKSGDVLLVRSNGSLSLVGQAALVSESHDGYGFAGYLLRLRPRAGVLSAYLLELLRSAPFRKLIEAAARSTSGVNNLSASRLAAFLVPQPTIEKQLAAVNVMTELIASTTKATQKLACTNRAALSFQEAARSYWLGQLRRQAEQAVDTVPKLEMVKEILREEDHPMSNDIEMVFLGAFDHLGVDAASFETLTAGVRADYDTLRDVVFKLLNEVPPKLAQQFDDRTKSILLRRVK